MEVSTTILMFEEFFFFSKFNFLFKLDICIIIAALVLYTRWVQFHWAINFNIVTFKFTITFIIWIFMNAHTNPSITHVNRDNDQQIIKSTKLTNKIKDHHKSQIYEFLASFNSFLWIFDKKQFFILNYHLMLQLQSQVCYYRCGLHLLQYKSVGSSLGSFLSYLFPKFYIVRGHQYYNGHIWKILKLNFWLEIGWNFSSRKNRNWEIVTTMSLFTIW